MAQSALPSDIERALQHAVGQANDAFAQSEVLDASSGSKKKKKKRSREQQEEEVPAAQEDAEPVKKKKKSKKHNRPEQEQEQEQELVAGASVETQQDPTSKPPKKKKKRSKEDKGKGAAAPEPTLSQPQAPMDAQAQSLAFLNAVVSAASATAEHASQPAFLHGHPPPPAQYAGFPADGPSGFPYPPPTEDPAAMVPMNLPYGSDDLLRALQDLDVARLASLLKTLGEAASAANVPMVAMPSSLPPPSERASTSNHHNSSNGGRAAAAGPSRAPSRRITNVAVPTNLIDTEHGHLLATKWMSTRKLKEMAESEGLVYKKGKFSMIEEQQLASAIEAYKSSTGIDDAAFSELVFAKDVKSKDNSFWSDLTSAVPMRPIIAVYHHVRRIYHPMGNRGSWMPAEDEALRAAVAEYGQQWENVSIRVNRRAADCRDRYRNHLQYSEGRTSGAWTKEEEDMLTQIVTEMTLHQGKDMDNDVFWGAVSLRMGSTRGRQQCRIKWTDSLSKTVKNRGNKPRWNAEDGYILVHKVDSLHVHDDTEIDWKTLPDAHWNFWSAHTLQRRWLTMKRSVRGYAEMSHAELMDILRVKKAHLPPTKQKVVSAEAVEDSEEEVDEEQGEGSAGPTGVPPPTMPAKAVRIAGLSRRDGSDDSDSNSS